MLPGRISSAPGPVNGIPAAASSVAGTTTVPSIEFVSPKADTVFLVDVTPKMPEIDIELRIVGGGVDPNVPVRVAWTFEVKFDESGMAAFGKAGVVFTDRFAADGGTRFRPAFPWIRGGQLTITASTTVDERTLTATLKVWIMGTDPGWGALSPLLVSDVFRRIVRAESGGRQFESDRGNARSVPVLNRGRDGGGGACQITPPSGDDLWSWRANVASGNRVFAGKRINAAAHPGATANSTAFKRLVGALNAKRALTGLKPLVVRVPAYTADQLEKDTIRGYNGYAGGLHEFRLAQTGGELTLANVDEKALTANAVWERVPAADRPQRPGDPNYVEHILNQRLP